jgi:hypothetical protein
VALKGPNRVRSFLQPPLPILEPLLYKSRFRTSGCASWNRYKLFHVIRRDRDG